MKTWKRTATLGGVRRSPDTETWEYWDGDRLAASFSVEVTLGKPLDVLGLKGTSLQEIRDYADFLKKTAQRLYSPEGPKREISRCPCCGQESGAAAEVLTIFQVPYHRCRQCGHVFVRFQPTAADLDQVFADSEEHAAVYTDQDSLETRLSMVMEPKLKWLAQKYRQQRGRELQSILDVGAGGGHFVAICHRAGLKAQGFEISKSSRKFARQVFGVELKEEDFLTCSAPQGAYDVLTFWGLLEYTPEPRNFLEVAQRLLHPKTGMLVVEVPRFDCLGTAIQGQCPDTVARHMDPTSHVNCFSDASLATALVKSGFRPVAAWYFGMDAYELLVQLALTLKDSEGLARWAHLIPALQASLDAAQLCDDLVMAAVPLEDLGK